MDTLSSDEEAQQLEADPNSMVDHLIYLSLCVARYVIIIVDYLIVILVHVYSRVLACVLMRSH